MVKTKSSLGRERGSVPGWGSKSHKPRGLVYNKNEGTYCIAQGTLVNTLQWPISDKNLRRVDIHTNIQLIHFFNTFGNNTTL